MMLWVLTLSLWMVCSSVQAQPVSCQEDEQCSEGYYCERSAKICRECLNCEDLKRDPPTHLSPFACIKSVADCGSCKKGLEVDRRSDVNSECVAPVEREESAVLPTYVWALIVIGLLVFIVIVLLLLRNRDIFKDLYSARTSVRSPGYLVNATAPDCPPPYNPALEAMRHTSAAYPPLANVVHDDELSAPFIKSALPSNPNHLRESADKQAARVYNPPVYEQTEQPPSSVDELNNDIDNHVLLHDEETIESPWTPDDTINDNDVSDSVTPVRGSTHEQGALSRMLQAARNNALVAPPPAKLRRTHTHTNSDSEADDTACSHSSETRAPPVVMQVNVLQINNLNDGK